jgi:hypothetical protein
VDEKENENEHFERKKITSQTVKALSWISSVKKVSASVANSRLFVKGDGEILFCVSVDGSKHSDFAFQLVTENFFFPYVKLLCIHIFNSKLDNILNYSNKKATVLEKYANKIERFKKQSHFVTEDKVSKIHALEQATRLADNYQANYLVCGYQGLKGPRGDNKEQSVGHDYLLGSSKTPVMIVREETLREKKKDGIFRWLVVLDKQYTYTIKALQTFLPLIDAEKDIILAIGGYPIGFNGTDLLKEQFIAQCEKSRIKNFEYEQFQYGPKSPLYKYVIEKINFGVILFDFVLIYNNAGKFKSEPDQNDASNIIKGTSTNVFFVNNLTN